ncbi:MAG: hypothetical protein H0T52_11480 [Lautropia sp.]|nr:hypothetical protein [Lautropia sp.]
MYRTQSYNEGGQLPSSYLYADRIETVEGPKIASTLSSDQVVLFRPEPFGIDASATYALDNTIAEWRPQSAADPWFAQLQIQTDSRSDTVYRLCWHARLPGVIRLWCYKADRLNR